MINYPYLPPGRTFKYVPADNPFMQATEEVTKRLSTDMKHPTGAVVVKDGKIIASDANRSALRSLFLIRLHKTGWCVRKWLRIPSGQKYWLCPGCASHEFHAEHRVVLEMRKRGIDSNGADLYHWGHWWCCKPCWDKMIEAGIKDVYLLEGSEKLFMRK
ncbi:MAG: hypothetical protein JWO73_414 [Candidatus Taylorbacteria bacterium]|nr:hypothetical protein [Candidatus Taylorbacteria bacterium]